MTKFSSDLKANYELFINQILETGEIFALQNAEGWAESDSENYPDTKVIPFWSQKAYAEEFAQQDFPEFKAVKISYDEFLEDWLPGMIEDEVMVGINWNQDFEDVEMEPLVILDDLDVD